jgi:hypothetical protein
LGMSLADRKSKSNGRPPKEFPVLVDLIAT